jgi:hypothetical protein
MVVMLVLVFALHITIFPQFRPLPISDDGGSVETMPVRMQMFMGMRMTVARVRMGVLMLMGMAMGVLVPILAVIVMLVFHGPYFSLLICTSSDRYSALSASVV